MKVLTGGIGNIINWFDTTVGVRENLNKKQEIVTSMLLATSIMRALTVWKQQETLIKNVVSSYFLKFEKIPDYDQFYWCLMRNRKDKFEQPRMNHDDI
jgi:hypothetical protein